ncbi:MAG: flavodoxin family protein [Candidatus Bathyarchaeia archaeon]|jgi:multimeric flavodoxin WrbA
MKILAIQSSSNVDGLTAKTAKAIISGAEAEGATVELINLNELIIKPCLACDGGWGQCRRDGRCIQDDEFQALRDKIHAADATIFATPVYWGDLSESAKIFLDRLRRCEVNGEFKNLNGKIAVGIASAGGTGNGCVKCLLHLEDYIRRVGFTVFDLITITQVSREHKLEMLEKAGHRLAKMKP